MIHRIDVRELDGDSQGQAVRQQIAELGSDAGSVSTRRIFLIDTDAQTEAIRRAAAELFADPIVQRFDLMERAPVDSGSRIEVHLKPGVMDPVAASAEMVLRDRGVAVRQIRTGKAFLLGKHLDRPTLERIASRVLANGVIESVHFEAFLPKELPTGRDHPFELRHVAIRDLNDEQLRKLSREGHLFLSLGEMKTVQDYFRAQKREPTDIELETLAQTWSEHCVHKTLKGAVDVSVLDDAGKTIGTRRYGNLIKDTIFASTRELMDKATASKAPPFCLSVFKDNAGVIVFDEDDAVCTKVETHNHPSAIEPYGGSATGIGGCIRDIMGTGLSARPVASTDVFCVAYPDTPADQLPRGVIHPKRTLQQVVAGVRDYGNRMGIPTVNGAVYFDERYVGNPLVFCGCVGMIPRDMIDKAAQPGDAIVVMGGRTGRDGIHGATFSSAELTDTHADEFSHAVQIGNAITQKQMMDVILQARDRGLFAAITDCGAGGLSSAVGEMGEKTGAAVELDKVPLKYAGLRYDEIWISEAQERMVLSVPQARVAELLALAKGESVEATVIGQFGTEGQELRLSYRGEAVGRLSMKFLHDGIPMPTRKATVVKEPPHVKAELQRAAHVRAWLRADKKTQFRDGLLFLLAHPNIASKHWIIRQYDHEVQGGSVIKPLIGLQQIGPSDAAVIRPKLGSIRGVALGCGLTPQIEDPYEMAIAAIDEALRNVVCVGAKLDRIALLDNFCWPSVEEERTMGTLVRACEACRDAAIAFGTPFISGKDSLHNQFTDSETGRVIKIPATLLVSAIGVLEDVRKCVTMDFKVARSRVVLIAAPDPTDLASLAATHRLVSTLIAEGKISACHDVSDGGIAVAAAEMCIASGFGFKFDPYVLLLNPPFTEVPGRYLVELCVGVDLDEIPNSKLLGFVQKDPVMTVTNYRPGEVARLAPDAIPVEDLTAAWRGTLDW